MIKQLQQTLLLAPSADCQFRGIVHPVTIGSDICALLNSGGGYVLVGAFFNGEILGVPEGASLDEIRHQILQALSPRAPLFFKEKSVDGKKVWMIEVPAAQDAPFAFRNSFFIRSHGVTKVADVDWTRDIIARQQIEAMRWERRPCDVDLQDIDASEVKKALGPLADKFSAELKDADLAEALAYLGVFRYGQLTNAGNMLFAKQPRVRQPQAVAQALCFSSDDGRSILDMKVFDGPLVQSMERVVSFIESSAARHDTSYTGSVLREAVLNAFVHRNYANSLGTMLVEVFPSKIKITNCGRLPDHMPARDLHKGTISVLRNPDIARILALQGYMGGPEKGCVMIHNMTQRDAVRPAAWVSYGIETILELCPDI